MIWKTNSTKWFSNWMYR